jgi:putative ABC transport system permease protein
MLNDVRYALRMLAKAPGFSAFAILTLAIGIGANSAIFSVVNGVLLKQLHYRNPEQLAWIWATREGVSRAFFSIPNFIDTREQNHTIDKLMAFAIWGVNLTGQGEAERLQGIRISPEAFQVLGVEAIAGRALRAEDESLTAAPVVMLGHGLWRRRFGSDPNVIGRTLALNGDVYTIVGVLPRDLVIPNAEAEVVAPLRLDGEPRRMERGSNFLRAIARLKPGVTPQQARVDLSGITDRLRQQYPDDNGNLTAPRVLALHEELVGGYREGLLVLLAAVAAVLLIACSNLANLQLARASARHREMAIRTALGATPWDLMRQLLVEGMLVALVGGLLGLLFAVWGKDFLLALTPADFPRAPSVTIDLPVLLFCMAVSIFAGIVLGLAPAIHSIKSDLNLDLKAGGPTASSGGRNQVRSALIVLEIALSLVLLIAAGLVMKSFAHLRQVNPGFGIERALAVRLSLPPAKYSGGESVKLFYDKLAPRLAAIPGVESIGAASALPMSGLNARTEFVISGRPPVKPSEVPGAQHRWVTPGYFHAMRIPLVRGRDLIAGDNERSAGVVIVDQALVRCFFAGQDPIGAHIVLRMGDGLPASDYEIVGIAESVKHNGLNEESIPTFYGPIGQAPKSAVPFLANNFSIVVRSGIDPQALASALRAQLRKVDADVAVAATKPMEEFLAASIAPRRFNLLLLGVFAGTALVLAAGGLYAVIAYLVSQRTREIGLRLALGAQRSHILCLILGHGFRLTMTGIAVGLIGAIATTRLLATLLFTTSATDPLTYGSVAVLLAGVALIASYLPARRAMKVDPLVALRYE